MTIIHTYAKTRRKLRHFKRVVKICKQKIKENNEVIAICARIIGIPTEELEEHLRENKIATSLRQFDKS
jgi:hypothetical protein